MDKIVAITVTYNRAHTLIKCIKALMMQTHPVDRILVVDNGSHVEQKEILQKFISKNQWVEVLWLDENSGGAGGFEAGMQMARETYKPDWYWIMDDDAYPRENCLEELMEYGKKYPRVGFVAPVIFGVDLNKYQLYHHKSLSKIMMRERPIASTYEELQAVTKIDANAFVGPLFSRAAIEQAGIADGSLFIYGDDTEYTYRVSRKLDAYVVKSAVIDHQDPPLDNWYLLPEAWWKEYYSGRNKFFMIREFKETLFLKMIVYLCMCFSTVKLMIAAMIKPKYKGYRRLRIQLLKKAMTDGIMNHRGKTIDPVDYNSRLKMKKEALIDNGQ